MRRTETIVKKYLAYFLPHMSAALSSFIALPSERQVYGLLLKHNMVLRGDEMATVSGSRSWLWSGESLSGPELWCLVAMDPAARPSAGARLFLLFTWAVEQKYTLLKPVSSQESLFVCTRTQIIRREGKLHLAGVATGL